MRRLEIDTLLADMKQTDDPVLALGAWCARHGHGNEPAYLDIGPIGPPEDRFHGCEIVCDGIYASGEGKTEAEARAAAARKMIGHLLIRHGRGTPFDPIEVFARARGIPVYVVEAAERPSIVDLGAGPIVVTPSLEALRAALGQNLTDSKEKTE